MDNQPLEIEKCIQDVLSKFFQSVEDDDPHFDFYTTHKREKDKYGVDCVKKYNEDLNTILIFAGILSVVGSAFVSNIHSRLQPHSNEQSVALLRAILLTLNQSAIPNETPTVPSVQDSPPIKIFATIRLMYASLLISLLAAFVAILGKQWLNPYLWHAGGPTIERCGGRQRKRNGLKKWPFHLFIGSLSIMLQVALLFLACGLSKYIFSITTPDAGFIINFTFCGDVFYLVAVGAILYGCPFWTPSPPVPCISVKETRHTSWTLVGRSPAVLSALWRIVKRSTVSAILRSEDNVTQLAWSVYQWIRGDRRHSLPHPSDEIREDAHMPGEDDYSSQESIFETRQVGNYSFESLKYTLSYGGGRESLCLLPSREALAVTDVLERGLRDNSPLCAYDKNRFSTMLRKMCHEHKLLPSSHIITDELKWTGRFPAGRGGSADVWRGVYRDSEVAIKAIRVYEGMNLVNLEKKFCREVVTWRQFRHPNLLPLVGVKKTSETLMLVSKWMEHGTLKEYITAHPETDRLKLGRIVDVARGLKYLHDWPFVHADLKSYNILIDSNHSARIADFGLSKLLRHPSVGVPTSAPTNGGSAFQWKAPELFTGDCRPTKESDIYAFGMVAYEVFARERPFSHVSPCVAPILILAGERPSRPTNEDIFGLSEGTWDMINRCWDRVPSGRPPIANLLTHFEISWRHLDPPGPEAVVKEAS